MIGIYKFTNKINNKSYIGQSINISKRIKDHFYKATCSKDVSFNSILHQTIRKYGIENFKTEVLEECTVEELDELEKYYIKNITLYLQMDIIYCQVDKKINLFLIIV